MGKDLELAQTMPKHKLRSNNLPKERDANIGWTVHITLFMY